MFLRLIKHIRRRAQLRHMDDMWRLMGGSCFGIFPPSYYATHTPEEAKRDGKEAIARLRKMVEEYTEKYGVELPDENESVISVC